MTDELSPREAARRIGATTRSVQRWIATGRLPARRVGGRWRVAIDALDAFSAGDGRADGPPPGRPVRAIRRVFVANRGEIAVRIARTADRLGIPVVVPLTEGPDALDLLEIDAVVAAAVASGADAVHPGFGFLAESAAFAEAVGAAGLTWIGPPPEAIRAMGDKAAARRLAASLGVAVVPGYDGPDQADERLVAEAERIGWPLLVKPAGGGGGKGMHEVRQPERLGDALAAARREARAAFGDDRLVLEKLVEGARHVEIQVLFDGSGAGVHLGERDCSSQRRHQKILEETPSPGIDDETRTALGRDALAIAGAVGYVGAGTCEFLVGARGEHWFLEMNTRLQVEHPVTEAVTGRDLVADQLRIASGEPLGFDQDDVRAAGHAVEVRLYAEDAEAGFLPATGRVVALAWPAGPGIRVDAGIEIGSEVTDRFDPMLAKVIAHGADRDEALDRLAAALRRTLVLGVTTNLRFLRWLVDEDAVRRGEMRIDTLGRIWPPDDWSQRTAIPDEAWRTAAVLLAGGGSARPATWDGGWRLNAAAAIPVATENDVRVVRATPAADDRDAAGHATVVDADGTVHADIDGRSVAFRLAPPPDVDRAERAALAHAHGAGSREILAPMPGTVLAVHVATGDGVAAGQPLVTLEAMKMEHVVVAPAAGTVAEIPVRSGEQVARGQVLASIHAEA